MIRTISFLIGVAMIICACDRETGKRAALMTGGDPGHGKVAINNLGCSSCHTIPGVPRADALIGPSLERIASRAYIGGVLKNTPENMIRWLSDPPAVDPLTAMPNLHLTPEQARDVAGYLYTLK
jgi:cytochrome c